MSSKNGSAVAAPWGAPPKGATHWQLGRLVGGKWPRCRTYNPESSTAEGEWSLGVLSVDFVKERWGGGTYRVGWMKRGGDKDEALGKSCDILIDGLAPKPLYHGAPGEVVPEVARPAPARQSLTWSGDPVEMFERIYGKCEGLFAQVVQSMGALHAQQLQVALAGKEADPRFDKLIQAVITLERKIDIVGKRVIALETDGGGDEEEVEEPAKSPSQEFEEMMLRMVRKGVEKYGEAGMKALAAKAGLEVEEA